MSEFTVRPFDDSEYDAVIEVFKRTIPGFLGNAESLRATDARPLFAGPRARFVAEMGGTLVGLAQHQPNIHATRLVITVLVLPEHRHRGIGRALFEAVSASALSHRPDSFWTEVSELEPESLQFAARNSFREHTRVFESRFDLSKTSAEDLSRLVPESFERRGLQIQTLANTTLMEAKRKFYELYFLAMRDVPNLPENPAPSFDEFVEKFLDEERSPAEGILLAVAGSELAGFSQMMFRKAMPNVVIIAMTGCAPGFRGFGIATTLKIEAMKWAKRRGIEVISTWNDSANAPILAINEKLGFERKPGTVIFSRKVNR